ncbi:putative NADH dehydrogenase/NAD(P)H nitroreductase [Aliidongia dinghuensis]|uniref:Putative NADH dehydrogenase/NAD(P)H nitroreductase GCM10011611_01710 n=1 Tax=Aliidongia dinghuensis TaxID=1867774 RepID=A0A8J2YPX0_9PROT|nr:malonic semialdehyde reductase [Aliidongia dinghuensis]GGE99780.1 putative NADH dehydrogenase/NAD(P)H nitroreductase [Aliidongia dinghuensis]
MSTPIDERSLDTLFRAARTHNGWQDKPVPESLLRQVFDLAKMGPTSANCSPMRLVFVTSAEGKERLKPALSAGNLDKTMAAPVTAIVAQDTQFYELLPKLFPHADARSWFVGNEALIQATMFRNASLQGAYLIMAARALGLDCGPMSGFDQAKVNAEFFPDGRFQANFLCNLGYGNPEKLFPRSPRFDFEDVCTFA